MLTGGKNTAQSRLDIVGIFRVSPATNHLLVLGRIQLVAGIQITTVNEPLSIYEFALLSEDTVHFKYTKPLGSTIN